MDTKTCESSPPEDLETEVFALLSALACRDGSKASQHQAIKLLTRIAQAGGPKAPVALRALDRAEKQIQSQVASLNYCLHLIRPRIQSSGRDLTQIVPGLLNRYETPEQNEEEFNRAMVEWANCAGLSTPREQAQPPAATRAPSDGRINPEEEPHG